MAFVTNGGTRIYYQVVGRGEPLVLAHGATIDLETWHELGYTQALNGEFLLILIDARGHGQSDGPHEPSQYAPECLAGDVQAVLDALNIEQAHYLGASLGAAVGFEMRSDQSGLIGLLRYLHGLGLKLLAVRLSGPADDIPPIL